MSIITEALKKAEQEKNNRERNRIANIEEPAKQSPLPGTILSPPTTKPRLKPVKKNYPLVRIILAIGGIIAMAYIINPNMFLSKPPAEIQTRAKIEAEPVFVPLGREQERTVTAGESKTIAFPDFQLTGIIYGEGEPWAMVDDQLLKQGDIIKGAQVVRINKDRITLVFEGKELTLLLER